MDYDSRAGSLDAKKGPLDPAVHFLCNKGGSLLRGREVRNIVSSKGLPDTFRSIVTEVGTVMQAVFYANAEQEVSTTCANSANGDTVALLGDCTRVLSQIKDETIDLIFADPPYNIGKRFGSFEDNWLTEEHYAEWCYSWLAQCLQKLKPTGSLYVMTATQAMPYLDLWLRKEATILSRIVWHYDSSGVQAKRYYGSMYEPILFCVKDRRKYTFNADAIEVAARTGAVRKLIDYRKKVPTPYKDTKVPGNAWYFPRVRYRMDEYENHPSQKPEALLDRIIRASTNPGDVVLDPFAGTYTTCAVAQKLDRKSIGIEAQEEYYKIGLRRLGISSHYQGEQLLAPRKATARKNANGIKGGAVATNNPDLFDA